jgi:serine/threonine-protein kinase
MNHSDIIASTYKIIENIESFEAEELFLIQNIENNTQYWLQHIDLNHRSDSQIESIKEKIKTLQSVANEIENNRRFAPLIELKEEDNHLNLIYEKTTGIRLVDKDKLVNYRHKTELEIIQIIKYISETLKLLHDRGFIHQMINPKNMIINTDDDRLILNNYGKITNDLYSSLMATVSFEDTVYITQEQLRGKASCSCDIYALGMVIINSLLGINVLNLEETKSGELNWAEEKNYTDKFQQIINKMIHPKIKQRYNNVTEILADIEQNFPEINNNNNVVNTSDYTPTEIILPESEMEAQAEEQTSSEAALNATQISIPDQPKQEPKSEPIQNIIPMTATEFVPPKETEQNNHHAHQITTEKIPILSPNQSRELISSPPHEIKNINTNFHPPLDSNSNYQANNLAKNDNSLSDYIIHFIQTPQGILSIFMLILIIVFGVNAYKNYLQTKKVEQLTAKLEQLITDEEFEQCITLINSTETQSLVVAASITEEFLGKCWLGSAEKEAEQKNYSQAIKTAVQINNKSADYVRAKQLIDDWSEAIFQEAQIICEQGGEISSVQNKLASIPQSSKWKKEALNLITNCSQKPKENNGVIQLCPGPLCPEEN